MFRAGGFYITFHFLPIEEGGQKAGVFATLVPRVSLGHTWLLLVVWVCWLIWKKEFPVEFGMEFLLSLLRNRVASNKVTSREVAVVGPSPSCPLIHLLREAIFCFLFLLNRFHLGWL